MAELHPIKSTASSSYAQSSSGESPADMEGLEENVDIEPAICHPNTSQTRYHTRSRTRKSLQPTGATFGRSDHRAVSDKYDGGDEGYGVDEEASFEKDTDDDDDYARPTNPRPRKIRTIVAASSLSMANEISGNQSTAEGFTFLAQEAYSCSCLLKSAPSPNNDFASICKVLVFFELVFFKEWRVIFCPAHNCFIPMGTFAKHLRDVHDDWTSGQKSKESLAMASHVADSLGLSPTQTKSDLLPHLPKELDSPLVLFGVFESYQCPKCLSWEAKNSGNGNADRYIRWKHLAKTCTARPDGGFEEIETIVIGKPRWTYRRETDSEFDLPLPKRSISESSQSSSPNMIEQRQSWPLRVGWVSYEKEIAAASCFTFLRKLIASPKHCPTDFLEKGLTYVRSYLRKYLRFAVFLLKDSHEGIGKMLVSELSRYCFNPIGEDKINEYSKFLFMTIAMVLRCIHAELSKDASEEFGAFKLRGTLKQFRAALTLYQLFWERKGESLGDEVDWAIHVLLETIFCADALGNRPIDCPTDQAIFLWSYVSTGRFRAPSAVVALLAGAKYSFRCIALHMARIQVRNSMSSGEHGPFFDSASCELDEGEEDKTDEATEIGENDSIVGDSGHALDNMSKDAFLAMLDNFQPNKDLSISEMFDILLRESAPAKDELPSDSAGHKGLTLAEALGKYRPWLKWSTNLQLFNTPFARIQSISYIITPSSFSQDTATQFDFKEDGQVVAYTRDGFSWKSINFYKWSSFTLSIMNELQEEVSRQLPEGLMLPDIISHQLLQDDLSARPFHLQEANASWACKSRQIFQEKMLSMEETRHGLFTAGGKAVRHQLNHYLKRDQKIRALLVTLMASTTAVCMRAFQFQSLMVNLKENPQLERNIWLVSGRFVIGKPKAKQRHIDFAQTLFWLPPQVTDHLAALLSIIQPFICELLDGLQEEGHLYNSHLLPFIPPDLEFDSDESAVENWDGSRVNNVVKEKTQKKLKISLDIPLIRQLAEGVLRHKIPLLFEFFHSPDNVHLEKDKYHFLGTLKLYTERLHLQRLSNLTGIALDQVAACLMVCDIWQALHRLVAHQDCWKHIVRDSCIFPALDYRDLAYSEAQFLKKLSYYSLDSSRTLSQGLALLAQPGFSECENSGPCSQAFLCAKAFLQVIRLLLFGPGPPRYAQTPPLGGLLLKDFATAGAMLLYSQNLPDTILKAPQDDKDYDALINQLEMEWKKYDNSKEGIQVSTVIFRTSFHADTKSKTAQGKALSALRKVKI
ncbi:hypothetical protein F5887DRAFT_1072887 [Amanita rubescens]|nr:hypothetical protein F5887DRAFT_1072887 [Amanita rubescens]